MAAHLLTYYQFIVNRSLPSHIMDKNVNMDMKLIMWAQWFLLPAASKRHILVLQFYMRWQMPASVTDRLYERFYIYQASTFKLRSSIDRLFASSISLSNSDIFRITHFQFGAYDNHSHHHTLHVCLRWRHASSKHI